MTFWPPINSYKHTKIILRDHTNHQLRYNSFGITIAIFPSIPLCISSAAAKFLLQDMDRRLIDAARTGNVELLLNLIKQDPLLLDSVAVAGGETPLHIAAMAGQFAFVQQMVKLREGFARELNQEGFSPLHIASANGYVEIVKELLKVHHNLCLVKGRDRRIPLHYAAIKGRISVCKELLASSPRSVLEVTAREETALHLSVKNHQFDVLKILVEQVKEFKQEHVLNNKDEKGNTILHLAVSRKQYEVVDLLLGEFSKTVVEVNSLNKNGLTPLDALLFCRSESGDRGIEEILVQADAKRASDLGQFCRNQGGVEINASTDSAEEENGSPAKQLLEFFKNNEIRDSPSEVRNSLLVVATLVATATYQAVLNPPGGVWQDDCSVSSGGSNATSTKKCYAAGQAVMATKNIIGYIFFLLFNSIGFFSSLTMIYILTSGFPLQLELKIAMLALIATYESGMAAIAPNIAMSAFFIFISTVIPMVMHLVAVVARSHPKRPRDSSRSTSLELGIIKK